MHRLLLNLIDTCCVHLDLGRSRYTDFRASSLTHRPQIAIILANTLFTGTHLRSSKNCLFHYATVLVFRLLRNVQYVMVKSICG